MNFLKKALNNQLFRPSLRMAAIPSTTPRIGKVSRLELSSIGRFFSSIYNTKPLLSQSWFANALSNPKIKGIFSFFSSPNGRRIGDEEKRRWLMLIEEGHLLNFANVPAELKADKKFIIKVLSRVDGWDVVRVVAQASAVLQADEEFMRLAIARNGETIIYASIGLKADKGFILWALSQVNGRMVKHVLDQASLELRRDEEVVHLAIGRYGLAIKAASSNLQTHPKYLLEAGLQIAKANPSLLIHYIAEMGLAGHMVCCIQKLSVEEEALHQQICQKITEYRNPEIGRSVLFRYSQSLIDPNFVRTYKELTCKNPKGQNLVHTLLPAIYPASWLLASGSLEADTLNAKKILRECFHGGNRDRFRKIQYSLNQDFLLACRALESLRDKKLATPQETLSLLAKTCQDNHSETLENALSALTNACDLAFVFEGLYKHLFLEGILLQDSLSAESINIVISKIIRQILPGVLDMPEEEFRSKYAATFGSMTVPNALLTYAIGLRKYPEAQDDLKRFIRNVLEGDQYAIKAIYNTEKNPTLQTIQQNAKGVVDRWKEILTPLKQNGYICDEIDSPLIRFDAMTAGPRSCLSVDSEFKNKLALLSASEDGDVHILRVRDLSGKIIARALLRLALDDQEQPLLILEGVYSHQDKRDIDLILEEMAIKKANEVGIPLITFPFMTKNKFYHEQFKYAAQTFILLGGRCEWTYSDTGHGMQHKESAPIKIARKLGRYTPEIC